MKENSTEENTLFSGEQTNPLFLETHEMLEKKVRPGIDSFVCAKEETSEGEKKSVSMVTPDFALPPLRLAALCE